MTGVAWKHLSGYLSTPRGWWLIGLAREDFNVRRRASRARHGMVLLVLLRTHWDTSMLDSGKGRQTNKNGDDRFVHCFAGYNIHPLLEVEG